MDPRIRKRTTSLKFDPPADFRMNVIMYHDVRGSGEGTRKPDPSPIFISRMSNETKDAYLTWRGKVWDRTDPSADQGFLWLRICELINDPLIRPEEALDELEWMAGRFKDSYTMQILAANAAKDLSCILGRPFGESVIWVGKHLLDHAITQTISGPDFHDVPLNVIVTVTGMPELSSVPDKELFTESFNRCLEAILSEERSIGRKSRLYDDMNFRREDVLLFDGFAYYGNPQDMEIRSIDLKGGSDWKEFLQGLAATICATEFWDWNRVPWTKALMLSDNHMAMVKDVLSGKTSASSEDAWNTDDPFEWEIDEEAAVCSGFPMNPIVLEDPDAPRKLPSKEQLIADIHAHSGDSSMTDVPYVPSGYRCMSYDRMTPDQMEFYLSWRSEILSGQFRDTDIGYLWLLLCEIIDSDKRPKKRLKLLESIYQAYSGSSDRVAKLIDRTCTDYAIMNKLDPIWHGNDADCRLLVSIKLTNNPPGRLTMDMIGDIVDIDVEKYRTGPWDYDEALNIVVNAMDGYYRTLDESLSEIAGIVRSITHREAFPDLVHTWKPYIKITSCALERRYGASELLYDAVKIVFITLNTRNGDKCRLKRNYKLEPKMLDMVLKALTEWADGVESERKKEEMGKMARSIVLDMDAVKGAEDDLRMVTQLISTDDDEIPTEPEEPVTETVVEATGWEGLVQALSEEQKGYLMACIDGTHKGYLKKVGITETKMEDSINGISMDTVGDQIVENGEVFEDYLSELSRVLNHHLL